MEASGWWGAMEYKLWNTFSSTQNELQSDFYPKVRREGFAGNQLFLSLSPLFHSGDGGRHSPSQLLKLELLLKCRFWFCRSGWDQRFCISDQPHYPHTPTPPYPVMLIPLEHRPHFWLVSEEGSSYMGGRKSPYNLWERGPRSEKLDGSMSEESR